MVCILLWKNSECSTFCGPGSAYFMQFRDIIAVFWAVWRSCSPQNSLNAENEIGLAGKRNEKIYSTVISLTIKAAKKI